MTRVAHISRLAHTFRIGHPFPRRAPIRAGRPAVTQNAGIFRRLHQRARVGAGFAIFWVLGKLPHRVHYRRSAYIPRVGSVLVVVNHLATTETLAVARLLIGHRRFPHFLVMGGLFRLPLIGAVARAMKQIPVQRGTPAAGSALAVAADELRKGHLVAVYPEGGLTRAPDLRPGAGRTGAARLALQFPQTPVVPIGQWGARPGLRAALSRRRVDLLVGEPVDLSPWQGRTDSAAAAEATAAIMAAVTGLVEQVRGRPFDPPPGVGRSGAPGTRPPVPSPPRHGRTGLPATGDAAGASA